MLNRSNGILHYVDFASDIIVLINFYYYYPENSDTVEPLWDFFILSLIILILSLILGSIWHAWTYYDQSFTNKDRFCFSCL